MVENRWYHVYELLAIIGDAEFIDWDDHLAIFQLARDIEKKSKKKSEEKKRLRSMSKIELSRYKQG